MVDNFSAVVNLITAIIALATAIIVYRHSK